MDSLHQQVHASIASAEREIAAVDRVLREWISVSRYATKYGISRHTLYKWMDAGVVHFYRVERVVRVRDQPPGAAA